MAGIRAPEWKVEKIRAMRADKASFDAIRGECRCGMKLIRRALGLPQPEKKARR